MYCGTGHVDPGEDESLTALRELSEESGLQEEDLRKVAGFEKVVHVSQYFTCVIRILDFQICTSSMS